MSQPMPYTPDGEERAVLDVLRREHRANPLRIREETDIRKQYVNDALDQLQKVGVVEKVNRGLYQHVPGEDDLEGADAFDIPKEAIEADARGLEVQNGMLREDLEELREERDELAQRVETLREERAVDTDRVRSGLETIVAALEGNQPDVDRARTEAEATLEVLEDDA